MEMKREHCRAVFRTPLGWAGVAASDKGLCRIVLPRKDKKDVERELESEIGTISSCRDRKIVDRSVKLLRKYFSGKRVLFDLPLDIRYYTAFQQAVWKAAAEVPFGGTRSYGWIAKRIRNPKAVRAVGRAMGANPIPIIIP
jgi:O6-methylguanine-DNA--protein-cysteine methyltransferase